MTKAKRVLVLIADDQPDSDGHIFLPSGIELLADVPVLYKFSNEAKDLAGNARLTMEGCRVYADIDITFTHDEPLKDLTPAIGCVALNIREDPTGEGPSVIEKCIIRRIGLSPNPNCDQRIRTLGEQGVVE